MRIAIGVENVGAAKPLVAQHFGNCCGFYIYEMDSSYNIETKEFYVNPFQGSFNGNSPIPKFLNGLSVNVLIAGGMGRSELENINKSGIIVYSAPGLFIEEAMHRYLNRQLKQYPEYTEDLEA